jgi:hypothetical protein
VTRHAFEISDERWDHDVQRLVTSIDKLVGGRAGPPGLSGLVRRGAVGLIVLALAALGIAWLVMDRQGTEAPSADGATAASANRPAAPDASAPPPSEPGTLATGKGMLVARGFNVPGCALVEPRIDATAVSGTLRIDLRTGAGPSGASFELYRDGDPSYRDAPNSGHLAHVYNVAPNTSVTMRYNFEKGQVFRLCASGDWYSPVGATNAFTFRAWMEPLAEFPQP